MDFLTNGLGLLAAIITLLGVVAGLTGYFKASRGDSIIKYQALENDALRRRVGDLEKEAVTKDAKIKTVEAACAAKDETITELKRNNEYLQTLGQGSPELKKMNTTLSNNTKTVNSLVKVVQQLMKKEKNKDAA